MTEKKSWNNSPLKKVNFENAIKVDNELMVNVVEKQDHITDHTRSHLTGQCDTDNEYEAQEVTDTRTFLKKKRPVFVI